MSSIAIDLNKKYLLASNGQQAGPYAHTEIQAWITSGQLPSSTLIWWEGLENWMPVSACGDFAVISAPPFATPEKTSGMGGTEMKAPVKTGLVWTLALAPLIGDFLQAFISGALSISYSSLWIVSLILNICLSSLDEKKLKEAGYKTEALGATFLIPIYLYKRSILLKQDQTYLIVWCIAFFISISSNVV